jgi:hypothetical protein
VFVPKVPSQLIASGSFYKNVDVIVGWNYDDGSLFAPYTAANETDIVEFLQSTWPNLSTDAVTQILDLYPIEDFVNVTIPPVGPYFFQASRIFRDLRFTCGQLDMSNKLSCQGASAYIYVLNETVFGAYLPSFFGGEIYHPTPSSVLANIGFANMDHPSAPHLRRSICL